MTLNSGIKLKERIEIMEKPVFYTTAGLETDTMLYKDFEILIDGKAVYCSITSFRINYRSIERAKKAIDNRLRRDKAEGLL